MQGLLEYIDSKYGSIAGYFASIGFSYDEQQYLRDILTEERPVESEMEIVNGATPLVVIPELPEM